MLENTSWRTIMHANTTPFAANACAASPSNVFDGRSVRDPANV